MSNGMILTNSGRQLLAKALTGKQLIFTRAWCGDGTLKSGQDQMKLTALISPKKELPIQSMNTLQGIGTCEVVVEMNNTGLKTGFFVREYGLFARDPDSGQELLYSYRNSGSESGYLEGDNGVDKVAYTVSIVTVIDQAPNVSAVLSSTNQYVTITRLDSRMADLFAPFAAPAGFWSFVKGDNRLRPASLSQTRTALWGDVDITGLNSRIERLEDAMNETMLRLELLDKYPGFSHYVAEDFVDVNQIDQFTGTVTSIVAGDDSLDIAPIDGMLPGSLYVITDGVLAEQVQVDSINLENGIQRVILSEPVKNTYLSGNVQIYRTSATIGEQEAIGTGARIRKSWQPELVWSGTGEKSGFSVAANTNLNNADGFTLMGNATVDNAGYVTLN